MESQQTRNRGLAALLALVIGLGLLIGGGTASATATSAGSSSAAASAVKCPSKITKRMCTLYRAMYTVSKKGGYKWDGIGCYRKDSLPYHPEGRACDLVYGKIGKQAKGDNLSDGTRMKNWLVKNHAKYKLDHVIWQGRIYSARTNWSSKGRPQSCSGVTACHRDHVHVAVRR
jgi:hypothetical protein